MGSQVVPIQEVFQILGTSKPNLRALFEEFRVRPLRPVKAVEARAYTVEHSNELRLVSLNNLRGIHNGFN